ncbi:MAG: SDR family oxidoreductase, partial [Burkholderiales bacterium]|nr:SDR family oxidoreductase [Burkholderiales bacterium]
MTTFPTALVTGAGSGIGQACATALLREGWQVVFVGRRAAALQAAIAAAESQAGTGGRAIALPCDVADEAAVAALFDTVQQRCGRLDLLFNNAGIFVPGRTPDELPAAAWRQSVDVNLNGAFFCLSHAF